MWYLPTSTSWGELIFPCHSPVSQHTGQKTHVQQKISFLKIRLGEVSPQPIKIPRHPMNSNVVRTARGFLSAIPQTAAKASLKGVFRPKMPGIKQSLEIKLQLDCPLSAPTAQLRWQSPCVIASHTAGEEGGVKEEKGGTQGKKNAVYKIDATYNPWHSVLQRLLLR